MEDRERDKERCSYFMWRAIGGCYFALTHCKPVEVQVGVDSRGVLVDDLLGQGGHVVAAVTLRCDVQVVLDVVGEADEEGL